MFCHPNCPSDEIHTPACRRKREEAGVVGVHPSCEVIISRHAAVIGGPTQEERIRALIGPEETEPALVESDCNRVLNNGSGYACACKRGPCCRINKSPRRGFYVVPK